MTQDQRTRDAERFRREARAAARLDHTGIATVYDLGEERGTRFLVMQYVTGIDLEDRIAEQERLSIEEAASVGVQIASVLGSVHARDVVHRDLKGRNVIIRTDGVVKVLDFGVAAFLEPGTAKLTTTGERPGSLECMAPEQILGKPVDHRTDLYALGCLLHKMLTGESVFEHRSELMLPGLILDHPPIPLSDLRPDTPSDLETLVLELLSKAPNDRPAHAGEVWRRLATWLPERGDPAAALTPGPRSTHCAPSGTRWGRMHARSAHGQDLHDRGGRADTCAHHPRRGRAGGCMPRPKPAAAREAADQGKESPSDRLTP
ncbi:serine/threonine-protein kinase [Streptomyces sp. M19]